jgi:hypothetical protein
MNDLTKLALGVIVLVLVVIALVLYLRRRRGSAAKPAPSSSAASAPIDRLYPPKASSVYGEFRNQYIDPKGNFGAWHDGLDDSVFARMTPEEHDRAEAEMIATLPDWRCIIGLGQIRSQKAIEPLKRLEQQLDGEQIVRVERALQQIGVLSEEAPGAKTRRVLSGEDLASNKISRMDAAMALREFPSAASAAVLRRAAEQDDDYLVRYHSVSSLLLISGYSQAEVEEIMRGLAPKLGYEQAHPRAEALAQLGSLIAARRTGKIN